MTDNDPRYFEEYKNDGGRKIWRKLLLFFTLLCAALALVVVLVITFLYPRVGNVDNLSENSLKIPLKIYTSDGDLIQEYGVEKRLFIAFKDIPQSLKNAILSIEDERFYKHGGIDLRGILRALVNNLLGGPRQGGSTITQQVARNFYLSSEKTYLRKLYEAILAYKIENKLTKNQILELYLNKIYMGEGAYGFASAAQVYFGKPLQQITLAEAAMLAAIPKAPSAYNPARNLKRSQKRQRYVLFRMYELGHITSKQYQTALQETLQIYQKPPSPQRASIGAEYVAEMVRNRLFKLYGDSIYESGLKVYTTLLSKDQAAANVAVRAAILRYEKQVTYQGPQSKVQIARKGDLDTIKKKLRVVFERFKRIKNKTVAVVWKSRGNKLIAILPDYSLVKVEPYREPLVARWLRSGRKFRLGDVIFLTRSHKTWAVTQNPLLQSGFISMSAKDGSVRALVGGFDFYQNQFNHVLQSRRQVGSAIKPLIYSAAISKGYGPDSLFWDSPPNLTKSETSGELWRPQNYEKTYTDREMTMTNGLAYSVNLVAIDILRRITPRYAQKFLQRFGLKKKQVPRYYSMALGAPTMSPEQLAAAYGVFASKGYLHKPHYIRSIKNRYDQEIWRYKAPPKKAVISRNNVREMNYLLSQVIQRGTARKAKALKRIDVGGKTGTTNNYYDAWFAGYMGSVVAVVWMGYDNPAELLGKASGGALALPVWLRYMKSIKSRVPINSDVIATGY